MVLAFYPFRHRSRSLCNDIFTFLFIFSLSPGSKFCLASSRHRSLALYVNFFQSLWGVAVALDECKKFVERKSRVGRLGFFLSNWSPSDSPRSSLSPIGRAAFSPFSLLSLSWCYLFSTFLFPLIGLFCFYFIPFLNWVFAPGSIQFDCKPRFWCWVLLN